MLTTHNGIQLPLPQLVLTFKPTDIPLIAIPNLCINNFNITYREVLSRLTAHKSAYNTIDERVQLYEKAYQTPIQNSSYRRKIHTPLNKLARTEMKSNPFILTKEHAILVTNTPSKALEFKSKALKRRYREAKKSIEKIRSKSLLRKSTIDPAEEKLRQYFSEFSNNNIQDLKCDDAYTLNEITKYNPIFSQLSKGVAKLISSKAKLEYCEQDKAIYREGEVSENFYILVYGRVGFYANNIGNFGYCLFGGCFGHDWIIKPNTKLRAETVFCERETLLFSYSLDEYVEIRDELENLSYRNDKLIFFSYLRKNNVEKCLMKEKKFSEMING